MSWYSLKCEKPGCESKDMEISDLAGICKVSLCMRHTREFDLMPTVSDWVKAKDAILLRWAAANSALHGTKDLAAAYQEAERMTEESARVRASAIEIVKKWLAEP